MKAKISEPSRTLNISLNKISLDIHREGIHGYIQFIHIMQEVNDDQS
jgi:hypothetical protein